MNELLMYVLAAGFIAAACHIMIVSNREAQKQEKKNYKNISLMAKNLTNCKVSTRLAVLNELKEDPNWSDDEVTELKQVLEGILNTKLHLGESKGLKIRDR